MELAAKALDDGIGIAPGDLFSTTEKYNHYIRLNYAHSDIRNMEKSVEILSSHIEAMIK